MVVTQSSRLLPALLLAGLILAPSPDRGKLSLRDETLIRQAVQTMDRAEPGRDKRIFLAVNIRQSRLIAATGGQSAWTETHSPGSLAKIPLVWHLISRGRLAPDYSWRCTGRFFPRGEGSSADELIHEDVEDPTRGQYYKCSRLKGHGLVSLSEALSVSCNHAFINLHDRLDPSAWRDFCSASGLTGSACLGGLGPDPATGALDMPGCPRDRFLMPLGFGLRVTPAGVAAFFTSFFSGGTVRTLAPEGSGQAGIRVGQVPLPPLARSSILQGMRNAARTGTAKGLGNPGYSLLAKTGSGLVDGEIFRLHGWCVAALPAEAPAVLFVSFVRESYGGGPPLAAIRRVLQELHTSGFR